MENTEIGGPLALKLYASTTDTDVLWFVTLFQEDAGGKCRTLTRGWLRGSQRRIDPARSLPWQPYQPHDRRELLTPGKVEEFQIGIVATGVLLTAGMRLGVEIKATDRDAHPSHLLVPVTKGNLVGTFMSGGVMPPMPKH